MLALFVQFANKDKEGLTCAVREALRLDKPRFLDYILDKGYDIQLIDWTQITRLYLEVSILIIELDAFASNLTFI